jgi:hypothetical protein
MTEILLSDLAVDQLKAMPASAGRQIYTPSLTLARIFRVSDFLTQPFP